MEGTETVSVVCSDPIKSIHTRAAGRGVSLTARRREGERARGREGEKARVKAKEGESEAERR